MADLITSIAGGTSWILQMIPTIGETIISTPYLLAGFCFFMIGGVAGIFRRFLGL